MRNWKTTLAGIAALISVVAKVANGGAIDTATDVPVVITAIGLLVAKDGNVTGGTVRQ